MIFRYASISTGWTKVNQSADQRSNFQLFKCESVSPVSPVLELVFIIQFLIQFQEGLFHASASVLIILAEFSRVFLLSNTGAK